MSGRTFLTTLSVSLLLPCCSQGPEHSSLCSLYWPFHFTYRFNHSISSNKTLYIYTPDLPRKKSARESGCNCLHPSITPPCRLHFVQKTIKSSPWWVLGTCSFHQKATQAPHAHIQMQCDIGSQAEAAWESSSPWSPMGEFILGWAHSQEPAHIYINKSSTCSF